MSEVGGEVLRLTALSVETGVGAEALQLVDEVSLAIDRGQTLCLVGESGSGKSMTARAVMGLYPSGCRVSAQALTIDSVNVRLDAHRHSPQARAERVSMIFQNPLNALNPLLTLETQLTEAFVAFGRGDRRAARAKALALLEQVGIDEPGWRLTQYPHQLSGGQRQRALIAMALMCDPALLIADEPTTALDAATQLQVLELLQQLKVKQELGMLFITHDLAIVARIADHVAVMYAGQIVESGSAHEVIARPAHPYTRALLACTPHLHIQQPGVLPEPIPGSVRSRLRSERGCVFAERCTLATNACLGGPVEMVRLSETHNARCLLA